MRFSLIPLAFLILSVIVSCKKNSSSDFSLLVDDATVPGNFGKKINLGNYFPAKLNGSRWGNSSEIFYISGANDMLKADFGQNMLIDFAPNSGGLLLSISGDQSQLFFVGKVNDQLSCYSYSFSDNHLRYALSTSVEGETSFKVNENEMLLYLAATIPAGQPCSALWDFWCAANQPIPAGTLYHIDKTTLNYTAVGHNMKPLFFSQDGGKAVLKNVSIFSQEYYILNMTTLQITDSFNVDVFSFSSVKFYWGNQLLYAHIDLLSNDIIIKDALSGIQVDSFSPPTAFLITDDDQNIEWSSDGRKVFYSGTTRSQDFTYGIWYYDLDSREETQLTLVQNSNFLITPFGEIQIAPGNHKMVYRYNYDLYLKEF